MKKSHLILPVIVLLSIVVFGFQSNQEVQYEYVTVKVFEATMVKNHLTIIYPDGKIETQIMNKVTKNVAVDYEAHLRIINKTFNDLGAKGYKMASSNSGGSSNAITNDYVFMRELK
ncbi:MAG: hypothetical protein JXR07_19895 [Reichenbachiella sp.]